MSLLISHNDDFAILLMYKTQSQWKSPPLITSLYMFFCIWFVLPFLGHHLCAVLFFNSTDKVALFGFLVGTISSGVCMCVCVCVFSSLHTPYPASYIRLALRLYILPSYCWELGFFGSCFFSIAFIPSGNHGKI